MPGWLTPNPVMFVGSAHLYPHGLVLHVSSSQFVILSQTALELEDPSEMFGPHFTFDRWRVSCGSVFVCWGCYNKVPQTGWVKQLSHSCLPVLEAGSLRSRCLEGRFLLSAVRKDLFHPCLQASGSLQYPLACRRCSSCVSSHCFPSVCVCLWV